MIVGVLKEIRDNENSVGLTPEGRRGYCCGRPQRAGGACCGG